MPLATLQLLLASLLRLLLDEVLVVVSTWPDLLLHLTTSWASLVVLIIGPRLNENVSKR